MRSKRRFSLEIIFLVREKDVAAMLLSLLFFVGFAYLFTCPLLELLYFLSFCVYVVAGQTLNVIRDIISPDRPVISNAYFTQNTTHHITGSHVNINSNLSQKIADDFTSINRYIDDNDVGHTSQKNN
jgi:hypothetical protein